MTICRSALTIAVVATAWCARSRPDRPLGVHHASAPGGASAAAPASHATAPAPAVADSAGPPLPLGLPAGYARIRDTVRNATRVPLLVPRRMLGDLNDDSVYVVVQDADSVGYSLIFSPDPECTGGSVCRWGSVGGQVRPLPLHGPEGRRVRLSDGRVAFYTPGQCNAGCNDAELLWTAGRYVYYVGLKRGRLDQLIPMAESVEPLPSGAGLDERGGGGVDTGRAAARTGVRGASYDGEASRRCLHYEPDTVRGAGTIAIEQRYGPPNFGETPDRDERVRVTFLDLAAPVDVCGSASDDDDRVPLRGVRRIQLNVAALRPRPTLRPGQAVAVRGTLYHSFSGHHYSDAVLDVVALRDGP